MNWRSRLDLLFTGGLAVLVETSTIVYHYAWRLQRDPAEYFQSPLGGFLFYGTFLWVTGLWMLAVYWSITRTERLWRYAMLLCFPLIFPYYFFVIRRTL